MEHLAALLGGSCLSLGLVGHPQLALANPLPNHFLLSQQIVDGLPPPPPVIFGQEAAPGGQSPSVQAPQLPAASPQAAGQYAVVVNGDSPLLLSQVRTISPNAAIQDNQGQRYILAGLFSNAGQAQQQVAALAAQGIGAQVLSASGQAYPTASNQAASGGPSGQAYAATPQMAPSSATPDVPPPDLLPVAPVPREVEFGQPPPPPEGSLPDSTTPAAPSQGNAPPVPQDPRQFFVVIPGKEDDLPAISNQVIRLGDSYGIAQLVQESNKPRGPHVQVGPFVDRSAADRWTRYFRQFGLDARIYYAR